MKGKHAMKDLHRLYFIEGIPGIGTTTFASNVKQTLSPYFKHVMYHSRGMLSSLDLSTLALLTEKEYLSFLTNVNSIWHTTSLQLPYQELLHRIQLQTRQEADYYLISYTNINFEDKAYEPLIEELSLRTLSNGNVTFSTYKQLYLSHWESTLHEYQKNPEVIHIEECALLQNHIQELVGTFLCSKEEILTYIKELLALTSSFSPYIIYLKPEDITSVLLHPKDSFTPFLKDPLLDWLDNLIIHMESTNYGTLHSLNDFDGLCSYTKTLLDYEQSILSQLTIPIRYYQIR